MANTTTASSQERPYKPSWVDRFTDWVEQLPIPAWAFYVGLGLGLILGSAILAALHPGLGIPVLAQIGGLVEARIGPITSIGHACHLGGGIAGWLAGRWVLRPRVTLAQLQRQRAAREGRSLETSG